MSRSAPRSACRISPLFALIQKQGQIPEHDMFNTFNMGTGMTVIVAEDDVNKTLAVLKEHNIEAWCLGEIVEGDEGVAIC